MEYNKKKGYMIASIILLIGISLFIVALKYTPQNKEEEYYSNTSKYFELTEFSYISNTKFALLEINKMIESGIELTIKEILLIDEYGKVHSVEYYPKKLKFQDTSYHEEECLEHCKECIKYIHTWSSKLNLEAIHIKERGE